MTKLTIQAIFLSIHKSDVLIFNNPQHTPSMAADFLLTQRELNFIFFKITEFKVNN